MRKKWKHDKRESRVDTSLDGFRYVGIDLTEQQYDDLCELNMLILMSEDRKRIPVFNTMLVLKVLGLLPAEMTIDQAGEKPIENYKDLLQRKFGRILDD